MSRNEGRGPPDISNMHSLKVDNLTYRTTCDELERAFRKYGEVGDVYIPKDRNTHDSRGFAFVRFYEFRDAEDAMDGMDGKVIDGREVRVAMARYGRPSNQFNPRGGGYGGGRSSARGVDRRRSPPRRRSRSRSRSRSPRRRASHSRSRSPRYHRRSASQSPTRQLSHSPARSGSRSCSRSPSKSPSQSRSPR